MKHPLLKTAMTPFPYAVDIEAPILEARRMMVEHQVHHLPVVRAHDLVGIISDRDIKLILGPELAYPNPKELRVEDAYMADCYAVDINTKLVEVVKHMADHHIGATVVTRNGQLAGIFTVVDACRVCAELLDDEEPPDVVA